MPDPDFTEIIDISQYGLLTTDAIPASIEPCDGACGSIDCQGVVDYSTRDGMMFAVNHLCDFLIAGMAHHDSLDFASLQAAGVREILNSRLERVDPSVLASTLLTMSDMAVRMSKEIAELKGEA